MRRTSLFILSVFMVLFSFSACKCGKKPEGEMPEDSMDEGPVQVAPAAPGGETPPAPTPTPAPGEPAPAPAPNP